MWWVLLYLLVAIAFTKLAYVHASKAHDPSATACMFVGIIWPLAIFGWLGVVLGEWLFADTKHMKRRKAEEQAEKARKQVMRELYVTDRAMLPAEDIKWIEAEIAAKKAEDERQQRELERSRLIAEPRGIGSISRGVDYGGSLVRGHHRVETYRRYGFSDSEIMQMLEGRW